MKQNVELQFNLLIQRFENVNNTVVSDQEII